MNCWDIHIKLRFLHYFQQEIRPWLLYSEGTNDFESHERVKIKLYFSTRVEHLEDQKHVRIHHYAAQLQNSIP